MKGHGKLGPMRRHPKEMLENFKKAWLEGVSAAGLAERFGIRPANVHMLARRLGLRKRTEETS